MKHILGNSPQCWSCKYYADAEKKTLGHEGYCFCPEQLRHSTNGRVREKPLERYLVNRNNHCKNWIDEEGGHTHFEVVTGFKEPYDGTRVMFD